VEPGRPDRDDPTAAILSVPSGTTLRFGTLVTLAIATTLLVFGQYASIWPLGTLLDDARCQVRANLYLTSTGAVDPDESRWALYRDCMSGLFLPRLGWLIGGLLALLVVSAAIYYARPVWRIRRSRLERLDSSPELWEKLREPLAELVAKAGLRRAPDFLLDARSMRAGGVAFGRRRRPVVCLDAGLVALVDRDRPAFDAVTLHELAHVRNGDVTTTYATLAVWRAFLMVVLLPFVLTSVDPALLSTTPLRRPDFLATLGSTVTRGLFVRIAFMVVLVYLARTAVLRSRERYADALVARWSGSSDPYRALTQAPQRRRVLRWMAIHPSRAVRVAAMREPRSLLRPGFWEVLASGMAVQLAWLHLTTGLADISWYREGNESFRVMDVVWSIAVGVLVCVIAWRGAAFLRAGAPGGVCSRCPASRWGLALSWASASTCSREAGSGPW
jgi:Zn-dependent protease with chaperone function